MGKYSGKKSRHGKLFHSIHIDMLECFKTKSDGEYVRKMFEWHPDIFNDIKGIVTADRYYDDFYGKTISKESVFGSVRVDHMINATLGNAFLSGLRLFERIRTENGELYCVTQKNAQDLFCCVRADYYPDAVFDSYKDMKNAVDTLRRNWSKKLNRPEEEISDRIDMIIVERLSDQEMTVYSSLTENFGLYGKLFFAAYYSINGNAPTLPNHTFNDNIHLSTKRNIESSDFHSLENVCREAKTLRIVAYTATSILAANRISKEVYNPKGYLTFTDLLRKGVHVDLVLSAPDNDGMADMINYKLRPRRSSHEINKMYPFKLNFLRLRRIMDSIMEKEIEGSDLNVYIAPFNMPCSYFQTEYDDERKDSIKVDMYIPMFSRYQKADNGDIYIQPEALADDCRPSFIIGKSHEMYSLFNRNIDDIIKGSIPVIIRSRYTENGEKLISDYSTEDFPLSFEKSDILPGLL